MTTFKMQPTNFTNREFGVTLVPKHIYHRICQILRSVTQKIATNIKSYNIINEITFPHNHMSTKKQSILFKFCESGDTHPSYLEFAHSIFYISNIFVHFYHSTPNICGFPCF